MRSTVRLPNHKDVIHTDRLDLTSLARGKVHRLRVQLAESAVGEAVAVPVRVARGAEDGPVVGLTAALHGNEVNGIPSIHRLFRRIDARALKGTVVAAAPLNVPGYHSNVREFRDGKDLNRLFPGTPEGSESQVYAHRILERIVKHFEYLVDLHTASFGRVNSLYIRADMTRPLTAELSRVLRPQIIVNNAGGDGTLRGAAEDLGIHAITVEIGNPQRAQESLITSSSIGLRDFLEHLGMVEPDEERPPYDPIECTRSFWLYTDAGGFLEVFPGLTDRVRQGDPVGQLLNEWGEVRFRYDAPADGVIVGKATNPVAHTGSRIVHFGVEGTTPLAG